MKEILIKVDLFLKNNNYKNTPKWKVDVILMPDRTLLKTHYRKMDKTGMQVANNIARDYRKKGYEIYDIHV